MCLTVTLSVMVRPFTLRDLALVRRLSEQGVSLHSESALADDLHPLRGALRNMVVRSDCPTLIWKSQNRELDGFIQLLLEEDRQHAHILYLSPELGHNSSGENEAPPSKDDNDNADAWLSLLDQAVAEVGQYGIHSLVAEVDETGPELPVLRRAGFAVYARQDIWVLGQDETAVGEVHTTHRLRPRLAKDDWDIQLLYANTVPRLVQLVEPLPSIEAGATWVQRDDNNELAAFVQIHEGNIATWMRFFIHPGAESDAQEILRSALLVKPSQRSQPVYLCLRRYEGWLPSMPQQVGFRKWGSQAVLVKHTVHYSKRELPKMAVNIENAGIPVSAPYSHYYSTENQGAYLPETGASKPDDRHSTPIIAR